MDGWPKEIAQRNSRNKRIWTARSATCSRVISEFGLREIREGNLRNKQIWTLFLIRDLVGISNPVLRRGFYNPVKAEQLFCRMFLTKGGKQDRISAIFLFPISLRSKSVTNTLLVLIGCQEYIGTCANQSGVRAKIQFMHPLIPLANSFLPRYSQS